MNTSSLYLGKARTLFWALIFALSATLIMTVSSHAEGEETTTCVSDDSNPGIVLACEEGSIQYILIDAVKPEIAFDVAMPLGRDRNGTFGPCRDVNHIAFSTTGPGCNDSSGNGYPIALVNEYAARYSKAAVVINGDLFGNTSEAYAVHGPEGLTIVNGVRIDGDEVDHGTVGDNDGEAVRRPSMIIRGDGTNIDIDNRTLLGIQQLSDSLNQSTPFLEAIGGCPLLVKNSQQLVTSTNYESVVADHNCREIAPGSKRARTAVGVTTDGKLLILIAPESNGLTLWEVADRMKYHFVKNAINLDGGTSTQLWYAPRISEGSTIVYSGRQVANALVVSHSLRQIPNQCSNNEVSAASTEDNPCLPSDRTPPTASGFNVSIDGGYANITMSSVTDSGGSGVSVVNFSAKWNNEWQGIGSDLSSPYTLSWNMCEYSVPDGNVEFGMEAWDAAGNLFIWSQSGSSNPIRNKSFNCNPNQGGNSGEVKLYSDTYYSGSLLWSQGAGFSNEPNAEGYSLSMPDGWSVKVWSDDNRQGSERCFWNSVHNLQDHSWQNRIQSMEVFSSNVCGTENTGTITMCGTAGCWVFWEGHYNLDSNNPNLNDTMEGLHHVSDGMSVMLFRDGNRKGTVECYNVPRVPLPSGGSADLYQQITDIYVSGRQNCPVNEHQAVILYDGRNLDGWSWSAGTGPERLNMSDLGPREYYNDTLESINIPDGKSVILYDDDNQQGNHSDCLTGRHNELISRDNRVSSIEIFDNSSCRPAVPFGFTGAPLSDVSIQLWWNHRYKSGMQYKVYKWNGSDFVFLAKTAKGNAAYIDNDVLCGADYFYKVSAVGGGESDAAGWIKVTTMSCPLPSKPRLPQEYVENGRLVEEGDVIVFEWTPSNFAYDYQAVIAQGSFLLTSGRITGNTWVVRDLPPNLYGFGVAAFNRVGQTQSANYLVEVQAAKAELIVAQNNGCDGANLYWKNNSKYTGSFIVHRGNQEVGTVQFTERQEYYSFNDTGLSQSTAYSYQIETMPKDEPNSSLSNEVSVNIPSCIQAPNAPAELWQSATTKTSFTLNWQDNSNNEDGFHLYRWNSETDWTLSETAPANSTTYTVQTTCEDGAYYKVVAFNEVGESGESNFINAHSGPCSDDQGQCPNIEASTVTFYEHWKCTGAATAYQVGKHNTLGELDNTFSGVQIPPGMSVRIYDGETLTGTSRCLNTDTHDFFYAFELFDDGRTSLSDATSSLEVFSDSTCGGSFVFTKQIFLPLVQH